MNTFKVQQVFYGWWIVLTSMIVLSIGAGFYRLGFGVFFLPLALEFDTSRTALSGAIALAQLEGGMLGPVEGYLVDRFGPRRTMLIGIGIMGLGFVCMGMIHSLLMFYVVYLLLISLGTSLGILVPTLVAPANWFVRKRGLALGITTSGVGIAGLFVPMLGWLILNLGWRPTAIISGLFIWGVGLPMAMVMRHRPEQYGLLPDGQSPTPAAGSRVESPDRQVSTQEATVINASDTEAAYSMRDALKSPVFWFLAIVFGLRQLIIGAVGLHQVPFLIGIGINPQMAATVLGMTAITSVIGRLGFGWLSDRVPKRFVMAATIGLAAVGALILAHVTMWWHLAFFVMFYGVGWGGGATTMSIVRAEYFGRRAFGTISGMMNSVQMFGLVLGPVFAGFVYDVTESYYLAFMIFAVSGVLAAILMLFIKPPRRLP
ncbi:MFS transporter [SAR202 cluster bacterium AC-647-N09_OGT_505m]|nr:MFS transporter [SAR202 cluster bacterium AC-647-N09_OGT_505m]